MFIEKLEPIDLGEPIYGRTILDCAYPSIDISPLRDFPDRLLKPGVNENAN